MEGEAAREAKPREPVEWTWILEGQIDEPEMVQLRIQVVNSDGQKILLEPQEFHVVPAGLVFALFQEFSPLSLGAGAFLGLVFAGFAGIFRRRSGPKRPKPPKRKPAAPAPQEPEREYVIQKRL
jgi:hypothetical protein